MNRANRILPVYSGDVSGACSALFELGGMVVIHDPSGCNSTYNTHDETRWYDHDSLIFISGLRERDAILGNDDKLVRDVVDAALELHPRFIALTNSPIPFISGTDFAALTKLIERKTNIPCFYVRSNGMHDYVVGAGNALGAVAERFVTERAGKPAGTTPRLNLLGVTPLDFYGEGQLSPSDLRRFVSDAGFELVSCWAQDCTFDELLCAGEADVNLVVSATGLKTARVLRERFGAPYVVGMPVGAFADRLAEELREAVRTGECSWPCRDVRTSVPSGTRCLVGEPVSCGSRAAARELTEGEPWRVVCTLEVEEELLARGDCVADGEEEVEAALACAQQVVADPLYQVVCPADARFEALPHLAFSGRGTPETLRVP